MKRILLALAVVATTAAFNYANAQTCGNGSPKIYTDLVAYPTGAPITIDGSATDWQVITGPLATGTASAIAINPYPSPNFPNNIQIDTYDPSSNSTQDPDGTGNGRDLRFFAFTYDTKNVYFTFRRTDGPNTQVAVYYFVDINADGLMSLGEPVIKVSVNGQSAAPGIYYYNPLNASGDPMVGSNGKADGFNMQGTITQVSTLPAITSGEKYAGAQTDGGYGWELAVPFQYLKQWSGTGIAPLDYTKVFTWHTTLNNGNSSFNDASDNAGGCCAGVAASNTAQVTPSSSYKQVSTWGNNTQYYSLVQVSNALSAATTTSIMRVVLKGFSPAIATGTSGNYTVKVSKDVDHNNVPDAGAVNATFNSSASTSTGGNYDSLVFDLNQGDMYQSLANTVGSTAYFIVDINTGVTGLKTFTVRTETLNEIANTNASTCGVANASSATSIVSNITTPLPVSFGTFTANRSKQNVAIKWETLTEVNNKGFYIQRQIGNGEWKNVAFVFSKSPDGNSSSLLSYSYNDLNAEKGVSNYRIQQVDNDGRVKYSETRSVRGEDMASKVLVFPNPSTDGKVSVIFDDANSQRDVIVSDIAGRVVKKYSSVTGSSLELNLNDGFYTIQVIDRTTAAMSVEKVVIKKR